MPLTKKQKAKVIERARQTGKWFLRRSDAGSSHEGFQWSPVGEWTEAPDWNESDRCGGGLHGNDSETTDCWWSDGNDLDFCVYDGPMVRIGGKGGKIKIRRAMVVLRNEFPPWLTEWSGSLDLENTGITYLGYLQSVGGWLDLRGTGIKPKSVKSDLKDKCLF